MGSDLHRDLPPQLDSWPSLSPHVKQAVTYELSHSGLMPSTGHDYDFSILEMKKLSQMRVNKLICGPALTWISLLDVNVYELPK